jgi:hypothetical protein
MLWVLIVSLILAIIAGLLLTVDWINLPWSRSPWRGTHGMTQVRGYVGRLLATALLLAVAAMGAMAETPPSEPSSFRNDVDAFAASVKVQTERVVAGAHRVLERSTRKLVVFKARMRSKIETWRAELSDEKAGLCH